MKTLFIIWLLLASPLWANIRSKNWVEPNVFVKPIYKITVIEQMRELGIKVEAKKIARLCETFEVSELASGEKIGDVPVPCDLSEIEEGRYLLARLNQLLQTPLPQLLALQHASTQFGADSMSMAEELRIFASSQVDLRIEDRSRVGDGKSLVNILVGEEEIAHSIPLRIFEYVPGREHYPADMIYHKGDLRKAILENPELVAAARSALRARLHMTDGAVKESYRLALTHLDALVKPPFFLTSLLMRCSQILN